MATIGNQPAAGFNERFFRYFQQEVTALQDQMHRLPHLSPTGGERTDAIDHCLAGIARLAHEVGEASQHLPAYDQRTYGTAIKALGEKLTGVRAGLAPRPRFTFRGQLKARGRGVVGKVATAAAATAAAAADDEKEEGEGEEKGVNGIEQGGSEVVEEINLRIRGEKTEIHRPSFIEAPQVSLSNHANTRIKLPPSSAPPDSSSILRSLKSCIVDLAEASPSDAPLAGLTLRDISRSVIICGVVSGPIHITNVTDSILVVTCRQYRMHECKNVDVYLHCGSKPIVEDVEAIRFTRLPEAYLNKQLCELRNLWDQVDDFKWLKAEPSPHWSILPESKHLEEDFWNKIILDESLSTDVVLKFAGIES